jgi:hypothetical protein
MKATDFLAVAKELQKREYRYDDVKGIQPSS